MITAKCNEENEMINVETIWIIRYKDGYSCSHFGTRDEAEEIAKAHSAAHQGGYVIA